MRASVASCVLATLLGPVGLACGSGTPAPAAVRDEPGAIARSTPGPRGAPIFVPATDAAVSVMGRVERRGGALRLSFPGVTLRLRFQGSSLRLRASSTTGNSAFDVSIDGAQPRYVALSDEMQDLVIAEGLTPRPHVAEVTHRTETWKGIVAVEGWWLAPGSELLPAEALPERKLLFLGDSVTCGEAVERPGGCNKDSTWWNPRRSYGMLAASRLGAQVHLVCWGGKGLVRDWQGRKDVMHAAQFFEYAVPDSEQSPRWDHAAFQPAAVVVSLGTNDFHLALGPLPQRDEYVSAYVALTRRLLHVYPTAHVFLTEGSIVNDTTDPARPQKTVLRDYIERTVSTVADPRVHFLPARHFPGDACDAHPTAVQHEQMAADVVAAIRPQLGW